MYVLKVIFEILGVLLIYADITITKFLNLLLRANAFTRQQTPKLASKPAEPRKEARDRFLKQSSKETNSTDTLIWDF